MSRPGTQPKPPLKVLNGWEVRRSSIPGNYNLTHRRTEAKSGKIAGWEKVLAFVEAHPDGKVERIQIGSRKYPNYGKTKSS